MGQQIPDRQNGQVMPATPLFLLSTAGFMSQWRCVPGNELVCSHIGGWTESGGGEAEGRTGSVAEIYERVILEQKERKKSLVVCTDCHDGTCWKMKRAPL